MRQNCPEPDMASLIFLLHISLFPPLLAQEWVVHGKQHQNCRYVQYNEVDLHFQVLILRNHPGLATLEVCGKALQDLPDASAQEVEGLFRSGCINAKKFFAKESYQFEVLNEVYL
jgi:hypothetical protein